MSVNASSRALQHFSVSRSGKQCIRYCQFRNEIFQCVRLASTKTAKPQDPEVVDAMPTVEYVAERAQPRKRLYSWGMAMYGNLGYAEFIKPTKRSAITKFMSAPFRLIFAEHHKVVDVACGNNFTVIAATSNQNDYKVFGTGLNTDSQIGYHAPRRDQPLQLLGQPVPIQIPLAHASTKVVRVACGRAHTVILTDKEGVFSLGNNAFGQCGRPIVEGEVYQNSLKVNKISGLPDDIIDISCGQDHTLFLTSKGEVYSCGWGADGQTGQGHYGACGVPRLVTGDIQGEKIIHVAGSVDCILAVSDKGDLFGWGNSEYGQFGSLTSDQQINVSRHLPVPHVGKVKEASAGGTACLLLSEKGQVYVWGYGILGQGPEVSHLSKPTLLPEPLFGKNEFNPDVTVRSVSCGLRHFAAITKDGSLFTWGKNKSYCLGLGHNEDFFFPFRVSVPAAVKKVSLGNEHTFAICVGHI